MTIQNNLDTLRTLRARLGHTLVTLERESEAISVNIAATEQAIRDVQLLIADQEKQKKLLIEHIVTDVIGQPDFDDQWEIDERLYGVPADAVKVEEVSL